MSRIVESFDILRDRLALLAVEAVQLPQAAVQVYWLCLTSGMLQDELSSYLPLEALMQRALDGRSLDTWAWSLAPGSLVQLLQAGDLLVNIDGQRLPRRPSVTWEDVLSMRGRTVSVRQVYHTHLAEIRQQTCRLWQAIQPLHGGGAGALSQVVEEVARGAVLFDAGFYFACHEYFEMLWGRPGDVASDFYQGLIQVAVAIRHLESHNVRGAIVLLHNGLGRLRRYPTNYKGLTLARFLDEATTLLQRLEVLPHVEQYQFDPTQVPRLLDGME
jgi:hypothetical protein